MYRLWLMYAAVYLVLHAYFLRVIQLAYPGEHGILLAGVALCLVMLAILALSRVLASAAQYEVARMNIRRRQKAPRRFPAPSSLF
jgi:hypothetical protein